MSHSKAKSKSKSKEPPYKWYHYLSATELAPQVRSSYSHTQHVAVDPPFKMPADVAALEATLDDVANRQSIAPEDRSRIIRDIIVNFCGALSAGRRCDRVTVLTLGETGQGKSTTINKLVGQRLLRTGRDQSTTKEIDSVVVDAVRNGVSVALAFDDTPGLQDTTFADRQANDALFSKYCEKTFGAAGNAKTIQDLEALMRKLKSDQLLANLRPTFRPEVYPNAIMLAARWDHVKRDAQNKLSRFSTPVGRAIWAICTSRVYDPARPNVVVVVTRALSDPSDYLDSEHGTSEYDDEWLDEAAKKTSMVGAIQQAVFPGSPPWPVVFVENWGNPRNFGKYDVLPNGERSHQNLFDAMRDVFDRQDARFGGRDLLGLQALATVISGANPHASGKFETRTLDGRLWVKDGEAPGSQLGAGTSPDDGEDDDLPPYADSGTSPKSKAADDLDRTSNSKAAHMMLEGSQGDAWARVIDGVVVVVREVGGVVKEVGGVVRDVTLLVREVKGVVDAACTIQ